MSTPQAQKVVSTVIAVDGPGAAGKSTVGLQLAQRLGYRFIDTGIMYRAVTVLALESRVDLGDGDGLVALAEAADLRLKTGPERGPWLRVFVGERDLTEAITKREVDRAVSQVSAIPGVRYHLVALQRKFASQGRVVMVGRDIGTEVLPDAPLKVYLDASQEERARRRFQELEERGESISYKDVLADLTRRDRLDQDRDLSPLIVAKDARRIDTTRLDTTEVVDLIERLAIDK